MLDDFDRGAPPEFAPPPGPPPPGPPPGAAPVALAVAFPLHGDTLVFTPDMDNNASVPDIEGMLSEVAREKRSLSSVARFEWVSADSLAELDARGMEIFDKPGFGGGKGKGKEGPRLIAPLREPSLGRSRRSRSRARDEKPKKVSSEAWEENRGKSGLQLLGQSTNLPWAYKLEDESRRSFVGFLTNPFGNEVCHRFFNLIREGADWKQPEGPQGVLPRKTSWLVSRGCTCTYRYGGIEVTPQEYPQWMLDLLQTVMPCCGLAQPSEWPNSCNVNLYEDGCMSVGWHADDERLFQGKYDDCRIVSLSFGAKRRFDLRLNWPEDGEHGIWRVVLGNGDLLTMEGMTQKHFQHRVPREDYVTEPRINLTWRWVAKHGPRCPVERARRKHR